MLFSSVSIVDLEQVNISWEMGQSRIVWVSEAVTRRCSVKNVFLKILQNSQENICDGASFLIKLQDWPNEGVFLWILLNDWEPFFRKARPVSAPGVSK